MRLIICISTLLLLTSCKKERLEGETSILIGTWNWTETYSVSNSCQADSLWSLAIMDSASENSTYKVVFEEKGKVAFYHNGGLINKNRIVFASTDPISSGSFEYKFVINTNNNPDKQMNIWVGQDSMLLDDFPKDTETECESRHNYFIKG